MAARLINLSVRSSRQHPKKQFKEAISHARAGEFVAARVCSSLEGVLLGSQNSPHLASTKCSMQSCEHVCK
jgi:hypothetical protein